MKLEERNLNDYLSLPYTIILKKDGDGDFVARVDELEGCISHGKDEPEAIANLNEMKALWIEDCIASGQPVPEPETDGELPSGKWVQRAPRTLHGKLVRMAKSEGVSLNQLVTSMLAEAVGLRKASKAFEAAIQTKVATYFTGVPTYHGQYTSRRGGVFPMEWGLTVESQYPTEEIHLENLNTLFATKFYNAKETKEEHAWAGN
jgi:antitoxin HicB